MRNAQRDIIYLLLITVLTIGIFMVVDAQAEEQMNVIGEELLPPNAKPGECYARVFVPPTYRTVSESVLKREAAEKLQTHEPKFEASEIQVMVKGPSERLEIIPAEYEWVEEQVLIQPEHKHLKSVPAVYETVSEKVLERPAHTIWKKGTGPIHKVDNATGEIMCLVEVPATYNTITKRVLVKEAYTKEVITPAKYKTVRRMVMKSPPTVRKIEIPAEYKDVKVRNLVTPAMATSIPIPEEYQTITRREKVTDGRMEWRAILCKTNIKPGLVSSLQKALSKAGYNPGAIDGVLGSRTMDAVMAYQRDKGLPEGQLTIETLNSLGLKL